MGTADKTIRLLIAIVLFSLWFTKTVQGTLGYVAFGIALVFTLTSFLNFCPLYTLLGIRTNKNNQQKP